MVVMVSTYHTCNSATKYQELNVSGKPISEKKSKILIMLNKVIAKYNKNKYKTNFKILYFYTK